MFLKFAGLRAIEVWLTLRLLNSPTFHRGVAHIHRKVYEMKHGPTERFEGGTQIDKPPGGPSFMKHFVDELKEGFMGAKKK